MQFHHLGQAVASLGKLLGSLKLVFLKHKNYEEAVRDFNASLGAAAPLPYDPVPQDAFAQNIAPSDGNGKASWWKNVLIISLVVLLFGLRMMVGNTGHYDCPT